jgi:hypothetical protein
LISVVESILIHGYSSGRRASGRDVGPVRTVRSRRPIPLAAEERRRRVVRALTDAEDETFLEMTAAVDANDEYDDADAGQSARTIPSEDAGGIVVGATGGVAAVGLVASAAVWGGVLGAASVLAAMVAVAVAAFVFTVAVARC